MGKINIEIPSNLILNNKINSIDKNKLKSKSIVGLMGYSKSGKDYISTFFKPYNYHRLAFADTVKDVMNDHMRLIIYKDLKKNGHKLLLSDIDFKTENDNVKPLLRPYIIWFSEKMKEYNGSHYWVDLLINKIKDNKIIITDVRRLPELDIFNDKNVDYKSSLFYVNQYGLMDDDELTLETIRVANSLWLVDGTIFVDSRIDDTIIRDEIMGDTIKELFIEHILILQ